MGHTASVLNQVHESMDNMKTTIINHTFGNHFKPFRTQHKTKQLYIEPTKVKVNQHNNNSSSAKELPSNQHNPKETKESDEIDTFYFSSKETVDEPKTPAKRISWKLKQHRDNHVYFHIPNNFDYTKSTEVNYQAKLKEEQRFVGKYIQHKQTLDYSYHSHYQPTRQLFHDELMGLFLRTCVYDKINDICCEAPLENWIVFTAGPMGAGKGHTLDWLNKQGHFPLQSFVMVDPDALRALLPEIPHYNKLDASQTGYLTQKEVGYVSEILTLDGLHSKKNVLVDGSLRDADWYSNYFHTLRQQFPTIKIAILSISANLTTVLQRAERRAQITGRVVPKEILIETMDMIPKSLEKLVPLTDFYAKISNEDGCDPKIEYLEMKEMNSLTNTMKLIWTCQEKHGKYFYWDQSNENTTEVNDWRELFEEVWVMKCGLPVRFENHHVLTSKQSSQQNILSSKNMMTQNSIQSLHL